MLKSLNNILGSVENQPQLQGIKHFQHLLECWVEVVGKAVAQETRPQAISRDVLYVATSSSVWAQELKFKRRSILKKLNTLLSSPLVDIHFSTAQWQKDATLGDESSSNPWQQHPSHIVEAAPAPIPSDQLITLKEPDAAFQHWADVMQKRSHGLPLCPQCDCPTPPGELQRWSVCHLCAAKQW